MTRTRVANPARHHRSEPMAFIENGSVLDQRLEHDDEPSTRHTRKPVSAGARNHPARTKRARTKRARTKRARTRRAGLAFEHKAFRRDVDPASDRQHRLLQNLRQEAWTARDARAFRPCRARRTRARHYLSRCSGLFNSPGCGLGGFRPRHGLVASRLAPLER
jgi:hypothetical protein